jgi:hypothetical protein
LIFGITPSLGGASSQRVYGPLGSQAIIAHCPAPLERIARTPWQILGQNP